MYLLRSPPRHRRRGGLAFLGYRLYRTSLCVRAPARGRVIGLPPSVAADRDCIDAYLRAAAPPQPLQCSFASLLLNVGACFPRRCLRVHGPEGASRAPRPRGARRRQLRKIMLCRGRAVVARRMSPAGREVEPQRSLTKGQACSSWVGRGRSRPCSVSDGSTPINWVPCSSLGQGNRTLRIYDRGTPAAAPPLRSGQPSWTRNARTTRQGHVRHPNALWGATECGGEGARSARSGAIQTLGSRAARGETRVRGLWLYACFRFARRRGSVRLGRVASAGRCTPGRGSPISCADASRRT